MPRVPRWQRPEFLGPPSCTHEGGPRNGNEILHGDQKVLYVRKIVRVDSLVDIVGDRNADACSVCGSKCSFCIRYLRQGGFVFIGVSVFVSRTT